MRLKFVSIIGVLALTACGFQPLHTSGSTAPLASMQLEFEQTRAQGEADSRVEFLLRQSLNDRMATGSSPYRLSLRSKLSRSTIGVTSDDIASRYDLTLDVTYILSDINTGDVLTRDDISAISTFGTPRDPYGRTAAQDSAEQRVAAEVADRIALKLASYFRTKA